MLQHPINTLQYELLNITEKRSSLGFGTVLEVSRVASDFQSRTMAFNTWELSIRNIIVARELLINQTKPHLIWRCIYAL